jgi:hypothetical protein
MMFKVIFNPYGILSRVIACPVQFHLAGNMNHSFEQYVCAVFTTSPQSLSGHLGYQINSCNSSVFVLSSSYEVI